jgi:Leucine-rich repeat (LRR) protein
MKKQSEAKLTPIRLIEDQPIEDLARDYLGLEPWATMIASAALGTPGPFTIGVHGEWGYGKTTLLRLAKALIEGHDQTAVTVWFNAWQYEREQHPLFPLIAAIADEIEQKSSVGQRMKGRLRTISSALSAIGRGVKVSAEVGVPLAGKIGLERDGDKAIGAARAADKDADPLRAHMLYDTAFRELKKATEPPKRGKGVKIVVLVDDLDRCQPEKAVSLLESIKLILCQPGFIFLIAVDRDVIAGYLEKRYVEQCGEQTSGRGRLYMDKIVQLPIGIPYHGSRFAGFVKQTVADLSNDLGDNDLITALGDTQQVLAAGAGTNPRSLIRLVNNFLLDCMLWRLIKDDRGYPDLTPHVTLALAFNRILWQELRESYVQLLTNQDLCDAIADNGVDGLRRYAPQDDLQSKMGAPAVGLGPISEEVRRAARALINRSEVVTALQQHGKAWLKDGELRRVVHEFMQTQRVEAAAPRFPEPLARAIREALKLGPDEPIPANRLGEVTQVGPLQAQVADADLGYLRRLPQLRALDLSYTEVTNEGLEHLTSLSRLEQLVLSHTGVTDPGLAHLKGLTQLQRLYLAGTRVTDAGLAHLEGLSRLQSLDISFTEVRDAGLTHLKGLAQLKALDLGGTRVADDGLAHLSGLAQLEWLVLSDTRVSDEGLAHLGGLAQLRVLGLRGTMTGDEGLAHLKGLARLGTLDLTGTSATDAGLAHLEGLTQLEVLHLSKTNVTGRGLAQIEALPKLRALILNMTPVGDDGLEHVKGMLHLDTLHLDNAKVTDAGLKHLKGLSKLRVLVLSGNEITDSGLERLKALSNLEQLSLAATKVTNQGLEHLKGLSQLHTLILNDTQISDAGVEHLKDMRQLRKLSVVHTSITAGGITELRQARPDIDIEWSEL